MVHPQQPIFSCSAQKLIAALMLQRCVHWAAPPPVRSSLAPVLQALETHRSYWQGFVLGPALPATDWQYPSGSLVCLRDLGLGWNADTLYILSPDRAAAEAIRAIAEQWNCTDITVYSAERTQHLVSRSGTLTAARWQASAEPPKCTDYASLYSTKPPILLAPERPLGECCAQSLMAALMLRGEFGRFQPEQVLRDLAAHASAWRSFVMGPALPEWCADLQSCLQLMIWLPQEWGGEYLYVWACDAAAAIRLQALGKAWNCDETRIIAGVAADQMLNLAHAPPIVVFGWMDLWD